MEYKRLLVRTIVLILVPLVLGACRTSEVAPTQIPPTAPPVPTATSAPTIKPGDSERIMMINERERSYLLYIPPGLNSQQSVPVIFAFHGLGQSPIALKSISKLNNVADLENFLVVYPAGFGDSWNTGENGPGLAIDYNIDESAFIREILSDLSTITNIDPKRIYAMGFSQGGALVYRLACDMSDTFATIAIVSGSMEYNTCNPTQAVSVIHVHGLLDRTSPFSGGGKYMLSPVEPGINTWVVLNECTSPATEEKFSDHVNRIAYTSCRDGTTVELYTLDSGTHAWPYDFPTPASEYIWDFFAAHPKP